MKRRILRLFIIFCPLLKDDVRTKSFYCFLTLTKVEYLRQFTLPDFLCIYIHDLLVCNFTLTIFKKRIFVGGAPTSWL